LALIERRKFIKIQHICIKNLRNHLRIKRRFRHSKDQKFSTRVRIVNDFSIYNRPVEIETFLTPGHWKGDLIV
jgi:IS30 family transposase